MLGPPLETFKRNKYTLALALIVAVLVELPFYFAESEDTTVQVVNAVLLGLCALWIAWLLSVRLSLHADGLSYTSLFGTREMRWDEVERFYYVVHKGRYPLLILPIGVGSWSEHSYKLVDTHGRKLSFGARFQRLQKLGDALARHTYGPLVEKLATRFNSGEELDFGLVRLSREQGLRMKSARWSGWFPVSWTRFRSIPLDQLAGYKLEEGHIYFWRSGQEKAWGLPVSGIPNAHVLLGLLDALYAPAS